MNSLDVVIVVVYFLTSLGIGLWFGRGGRTTHDFFLGGRRQHWFLAGVSIIATEVSAVTLIAVPAESYRGDWNYLQMYAGAFLGRMLIVYLLLPAFYQRSVTTVYEYLGRRFGPWTRTCASLLFIVSRVMGSALRLLIASLALAEVFHWNLVTVMVGATTMAILYTVWGGIRAVLWTDLFQAGVFLCAGVALVICFLCEWSGPLATEWGVLRGDGKLQVFHWGLHPNNDRAFWVLLIHATFLNMAALGTDQDMTQRMLICPDVRRARRSLIMNALAGFPIVCLFLTIGTLLHGYLAVRPDRVLPDHVAQRSDLILPYFIASLMPWEWGLRGLWVSAIFAASMSSLSSAIAALASSTITDLYRPYARSKRGDDHFLRVARWSTGGFGVVLVLVGLVFSGSSDSLLWEVFKWAGLVFGGLLGAFLLGVLTKNRGWDRLNAVTMLGSVFLLGGLKVVQDGRQHVWIAWPWWVVIGAFLVFVPGCLVRTRPEETVPG